MTAPECLAVFGFPGWMELVIVAAVGLILFGRRLPDVARSLGQSIVEFKKGIKDIQKDVDTASDRNDTKSLPPSNPNNDSVQG